MVVVEQAWLKRSVVKALCLGLLPTPTKEISNDGSVISSQREISMREKSKQLGFSVGTGHRTLLSVEKKRSDIAEGRKEGSIMLNEDEQRTKYTNELLEALEYWVENNDMVHHSPFKDNLVIKRDRDGSIVRDPTTRQPVRVQKMMLMCNPRILHNHMIEHFEDATEGNRVVISESKLRDILKTSCSHVKKMSAREKLMCGCETCVIFEDIHKCLNLFQKKYITRLKLKRELQEMRDGRRKFDLSVKLDTYIQQVCNNPTDLHPKYKSAWDAASQLGSLVSLLTIDTTVGFNVLFKNALNVAITGKT